MSSTEDKTRGFVVTDRRSFTGGEPPPEPKPAEPTASAPAAAEPAGSKAATSRLPPVDFHTFVISLGSSALIHLGDIERPEAKAAGKSEKDLPMAKHTIDLLSMLQEKTKGNLTHEEAQLLETLLYDLRLRYVTASK